MNASEQIRSGCCYLGIEFGSTRIKAVLIDHQTVPIASGVCEWSNRFEDGIWTYSLENVKNGLQSCFADHLRIPACPIRYRDWSSDPYDAWFVLIHHKTMEVG